MLEIYDQGFKLLGWEDVEAATTVGSGTSEAAL
jgi:hypothetical protein